MTTVEYQVSSGSGDLYWREDNDSQFFPADVGNRTGLGTSAPRKYHFLLDFENVTIPAGATIDTVYLKLNGRSITGSLANIHAKISAVDSSSPVMPVNRTEANALTLTTAQVDYDPTSWNNNVTPGEDQWNQSPEIKTVVQELVGSYTYSGGSIIIAVKDDGSSLSSFIIAHSYDATATYAPILHLEYSTGTGSLIISPSGIASTENFGNPIIVTELQYLSASGIASAEAFGSANVVIPTQTIQAVGIPSPTGDLATDILFVHKSVGSDLITSGSIRAELASLNSNYDFWDYRTDAKGLIAPDGSTDGTNYSTNNPYTPLEYDPIFMQTPDPLDSGSPTQPTNAITGLLRHQVIIWKGCFTSHITTSGCITAYQNADTGILSTIDAHPDKLFIYSGFVPTNPAANNATDAARDRTYNEWVKDLPGTRSNLKIFPIFEKYADNNPLSDEYNMLRADYRTGTDSHPIPYAHQVVGPVFAEFIDTSIKEFSTSFGTPTLSQQNGFIANSLTVGSPLLGNPVLTISGGESLNFIANNFLTNSPILGNPEIKQNHVFTTQGLIIGSPIFGNSGIIQNHNYLSNSLLIGSPIFGNPTIKQNQLLVANNLITGPPIFGNPTIVQNQIFSANNFIVGSPVLGNPLINGGIQLLKNDFLIGSPVFGNPILKQNHIFAGNNLVSGNIVFGNPVLSVGLIFLNSNDMTVGAPVLGSPALKQIHNLRTDGISVTPILGNGLLRQNHSFVVNNLVIGNAILGNPAFFAGILFIANDLTVRSPSFGNPSFSDYKVNFAAYDLSSGPPIFGNPILRLDQGFTANNLVIGTIVFGNPRLTIGVVQLVVTPLERTYFVGNEKRTYYVKYEDRTYHIKEE